MVAGLTSRPDVPLPILERGLYTLERGAIVKRKVWSPCSHEDLKVGDIIRFVYQTPRTGPPERQCEVFDLIEDRIIGKHAENMYRAYKVGHLESLYRLTECEQMSPDQIEGAAPLKSWFVRVWKWGKGR